MDIIRLTEAISTHSTVLLHDAEDLKQELSLLASKKDKLRYSSSFAEDYWTAIKDLNSEHNIGITSSEVNFKTRVSAELSTLVTTLAPVNNTSSSCKNQILTKTLMVPIIDHRGRTDITLINGKMIPRGGNGSHYYIISKDAVLSKETQLVDRYMCTADITVNATTTPSPDVLIEIFMLEFNGTIKFNETCPGNGSSSSVIHVISSPATIKLPVISCGVVILRSAETKMVHTTHHRMIIIQDNLVEEEVELKNNTFSRSFIPPAAAASQGATSWFESFSQSAKLYQTPLSIAGAVVAAMMVMALPAKLMLSKSRDAGAVNVNNYNTANSSADNSNTVETPVEPTCPASSSPSVAPYNIEAIEELDVKKMKVILEKKIHLRSAWERLAADKWTQQQNQN